MQFLRKRTGHSFPTGKTWDMIPSIIKDGDIFTVDGEVLEVCGGPTPGQGFWFKSGSDSYYNLRTYTREELEDLLKAGRLVVGREVVFKSNIGSHWHSWKRYTGIVRIYDYCECGEKKELDWTTIGEGKYDSKRKT